jgi:hypothetical protein
MAQDFYDPIQIAEYIEQKIDGNKATLGLTYVGFGEENFLPEFPAAIVSPEGGLQRRISGLQKFDVDFEIRVWVLHANLNKGMRDRTREEIDMSTRVRKLLHSDMTLGGHIIHGYVTNEQPGRLHRSGAQTSLLSTLLVWEGTNRVLFQDS